MATKKELKARANREERIKAGMEFSRQELKLGRVVVLKESHYSTYKKGTKGVVVQEWPRTQVFFQGGINSNDVSYELVECIELTDGYVDVKDFDSFVQKRKKKKNE